MEIANQRRWLTLKINLLEEQRDQLHVVVDGYINKVLHIGKSWVEGKEAGAEGEALTYREISHMIEDTAMLVTEKCAELASDNQVTSTTQRVSAVTTTSQDVTTASSQIPGEPDCLKLLMARVAVMEEAVSSLGTKVGNVLERQSAVEKCGEEVIVKHSERDKECDTHMQKIEKVLETVQCNVKQMGSDIGYVESSLNYDKQIETMKERIETCEQKIEKFETLSQKVKNLEAFGKRIEKLETRGQKVDKIDTMTKKLEKLGTVEQKIVKLETLTQDKLEKLEAVKKETEKVKVTTDELSRKLETHEASLQNLASSVDSNKNALKESTQSRETDGERIREIQDKLVEVERKEYRTRKSLEKKYGDVEEKYKMVCKIVADRLAPLEQLRGIFKKNIESRNENTDKLNGEVVEQVSVLEPKVAQLESHLGNHIECTAFLTGLTLPDKNSILKKWTKLTGTTCSHFDTKRGMFTAPVDGVYGVCLSMWQWYEGKIKLVIQKILSGNSPNQLRDEKVVSAYTKQDDGTYCGFTTIDLKTNNKLYIRVVQSEQNAVLNDGFTRFSIFLIR